MIELDPHFSWTLFLDRDGVINNRKQGGYITSVEEFQFLPFVKEGLKRLSKQFFRIIIVTNQQGVGKGIMTEVRLEEIHSHMIKELKKEGVEINKICVATNLRGAEKDRRKPSSVMGEETKIDFPEIDFNRSVMVGDTDSDMKFGMNLGMKTVLIKSDEEVRVKPDIIVNNLKELANAFNY